MKYVNDELFQAFQELGVDLPNSELNYQRKKDQLLEIVRDVKSSVANTGIKLKLTTDGFLDVSEIVQKIHDLTQIAIRNSSLRVTEIKHSDGTIEYELDKTSSLSTKNNVYEALVSALAIKEERIKLIKTFETTLNRIEQRTLRKIIFYSFVQGENGLQLGTRLKYSQVHVYRLQNKAVIEFMSLMECEEGSE